MPRKKALLSHSVGKTALCYIRQSYTRDEEHTNSPERQRANIQRNGVQPGSLVLG